MIVSIYSSDGGEYYLCPVDEFYGSPYKIDVTQKFFDRYKAYEAEQEFIQSKLHRYYTEAKTVAQTASILKKSKEEGKPSIGF